MLRSEPLRKMTAGPMKEAVDGVAEIRHVEPHIFDLYMEFAYTGIYRARATNGKVPVLQKHVCIFCGFCLFEADASGPEATCQRQHSSHHRTGKYCAHCGEPCDYSRLSDNYCCPTCVDEFNKRYPSWLFKEREHSLTNTSIAMLRELLSTRPEGQQLSNILIHARLFTFAHMFLIDNLGQLCLYKLHQDLLVYCVNETSIQDVIELVDYSYSSTERASKGFPGVGADLRELVLAYTVNMASELLKFDDFRSFLYKHIDFTADFAIQSQQGANDRLPRPGSPCWEEREAQIVCN